MIAIMSVIIKCFVITIIIVLFSCLSSIVSSNSNAIKGSLRDSMHDMLLSGGGVGHSLTNADSGHAFGENSFPPNAAAITSSASADSAVAKGSCSTRADCQHYPHTFCDTHTHQCRCNGDFIQIHHFINSSTARSSGGSALVCLPVAKLDDRCQSQEQCVVSHSLCMFVDPVGAVGYRNVSSHYCKCREGYHQEDRDESITRDNQRITNRPVCGEFVSMGNHWIGTFAIVCIMLLVILIGCFVGIVRFQRWKQRPLSSTVTSLAQSDGHRQQQHMMSSSPPPMGSVEAEFQNDFIQVFPMHHLEPMPDKNTAHEFTINRG